MVKFKKDYRLLGKNEEAFIFRNMEKLDKNFKYCVIGNPIQHSKSPQMQNAAFKFHDLGDPYGKLLVEREELSEFAQFLRQNLLGCNVTVPFKETIIPFLDEVDPVALQAKSVNTVINKNGKLFGFSTDGYGLENSLRENFGLEIAGKSIIFIGVGGAAQALAWHFASLGAAEIYLFNRSLDKAELLKNEITSVYADCWISAFALVDEDNLKNAIKNSDVIIQATSLGLKETDLPPFKFDLLLENKKIKVADLIYHETPLLNFAKNNCFDYVNGKDMLIYQGAKSFELWTGLKAPIELMKKAIE